MSADIIFMLVSTPAEEESIQSAHPNFECIVIIPLPNLSTSS
jgi:hypothetical protein